MSARRIATTAIIVLFVTGLVSGGTPVANASPANTPSASAVSVSQVTTPTSNPLVAASVDDVCQTDITVTNYDTSHHQVGRSKSWTAEAQATCVDATPTELDSGAGIIQPKESLTGHIYPPSDPSVTCRTVDIARSRYSSFGGTLLFMYHHVQRWCWGLTTVFPQSNSAYFDHLDGLQQVDAQIDKADDYFYKYGWGNPLSGWYSLRGGHSHVAVFWYRMDYYPYVKIWAHGDGSANWERGD